VEFLPKIGAAKQSLREGSGAVAEGSRPPRLIAANAAAFASLFELQGKSLAAESSRYDQWRARSQRLNQDPSLLVHFDFDHSAPSDWRLHNASSQGAAGRTAPLSAANGSKAGGRPSRHWSFEA